MTVTKLIRLTLLVLGLSTLAFAGVARADTRVALVIGNSAYMHGGRLTNPANDAALVAQSLRKVGFNVTARSDLGKTDLEAALKSFTRAAAGADIALVYYAGHGIEKGGVNYLVPVDATLAADSDVDFEAVPLDLVMHSVGGATRLKIVILDACRNNPFRETMRRTSGTRGIGQGLAKPPDPEEGDMLVAYAAQAGATAEDGSGANSPFAESLARHIPDQGVDIRLMFGKIRDDVRAATHRRQEPTVYESLGGEQFVMAPGAGKAMAVATASAPPDARTVDLTFWQSVEGSGEVAQYNAYLNQFPSGAFAALAREKIEALSRQPAAPPGGSAPVENRPASRDIATGPTTFDGRWVVVQTCPASQDGAAGYSFQFPAEVRNAHLTGERGEADHPGWVSLDGVIQADGSAQLEAHGRTGMAQYAIGHVGSGVEFRRLVSAHFDGDKGAGQWVANRICQFAFNRQ
jgi:uncharacterized caspase-like protein